MNIENRLETIIAKPQMFLYEESDLTCKIIYWCKEYLQRGSDFKYKPDAYIALMTHSQHFGSCVVGTLAKNKYDFLDTKEPSLIEKIFSVSLSSVFLEICRFSLCPFVSSVVMKKYASRLLISDMIEYAKSTNVFAFTYPVYMISLPRTAAFLEFSMECQFLEEIASSVNLEEVPPQSRCYFERGPRLYKIHIDKLM